MMRLHELLAGFEVEGLPAANPEVRGLGHDSRRIQPGDLFAAIVGEHFDGRRFAAAAAERGAAAVLGPGPAPEGLAVPWVRVESPRPLLGPLAARLYGRPHDHLRMVGITGTNGKSSVVTLLAAMLDAAGQPAGTLGTLGYFFGDRCYSPPEVRTTPEAPDLFRTLSRMRRADARAVVMEASSHGLELGRVTGVSFDVALFTNLTRDHLDFHGDLESYFAAKRRLFEQLKPAGRAVVSVADAWGRRLAAELEDPLTFGPGGAVAVEEAELGLDGIRARVRLPEGELRFESPLLGRFNLENLLASIAAAWVLGLDRQAVLKAIAERGPIPGRLEPVRAGQDFPVLVDFAHTPAALEAALRSLRELSERRIVVVFGCGGDRDPGKRPMMGQLAGELADLAIATSDNPRNEDPLAILAAVEEGLRASGTSHYRIVSDRREAIRQAVATARSGDGVVLVAGKGHEEMQIVGGETIPFSDRRELVDALQTSHGPRPAPPPAQGEECRGRLEADHG